MTETSVRPRTTVVIVPRENFSLTPITVKSLLGTTPPDTPIVLVDGRSPRRTRRYLESVARRPGFTLLRTEHYLTPNEARNLALPHVATEFVAFLDNDVVMEPGWLRSLEECALATGAWLVSPVTLYRRGERPAYIHHAGGTSRIVVEDGRRVHRQSKDFARKDLASVRGELTRHETGTMEYHCVLARMSALEAVGPLDERYLSLHEDTDLSLVVLEQGGTIWFEPGAVVTYLAPVRPALSDIPYWVLRWSDAWNRASIEHFWAKWALSPDEHTERAQRNFGTSVRHAAYRPYRSPLTRMTRRLLGRPARLLPDRIIQPIVYRRETGRRAAQAAPAVALEGSRES